MPIQTTPMPAPIGGERQDVPASLISPFQMSDSMNVQMQEGYVEKRYGYDRFGGTQPLSGPITGAFRFQNFGSTTNQLIGTTLDLYKWNSSSSEFDILTPLDVVVDDCEVNWTAKANVVSALDAVDFKENANSVKLTVAGAFTTGILATNDFSGQDWSSSTHARFWIKSSVALDAGDLQFLADDTSACASPLETIDVPALVADTWTRVLLPLADAASDTAIISIGLQATVDVGVDTVIRVDDFNSYICFTGGDNDFWSFTTFRQLTETDVWLIATNGVDAMVKWDGAATEVSALGGSPPVAESIFSFKNQLIVCGPTEASEYYPTRLRWSDTGDAEEWTTGNASFVDLNGESHIVGGIPYSGDVAVVFRVDSIYTLRPTGTTDIFHVHEQTADIGCLSGRTIAIIPHGILFLSKRGIDIFDGFHTRSASDNLGRDIVKYLNGEQYDRCFALIDFVMRQYYLYVVPVGETYPGRIYKYDYNNGAWASWEWGTGLENPATTDNTRLTAGVLGVTGSTLSIDDLPGTMDSLQGDYDDQSRSAGSDIPVVGDKDGYVYADNRRLRNDDGTPIYSYFDTSDLQPTAARGQRFTAVQLDVWRQGGAITVSYLVDGKESGGTSNWATAGTISASSEWGWGSLTFRVDCASIRFRLSNIEAATNYKVKELRFRWRPSGKRVV